MTVRVEVTEKKIKEARIGTQTFSLEDAEQIWRDLAVALGKPKFEYGDCGNAYSHGPHFVGTTYCRGHAFDRT